MVNYGFFTRFFKQEEDRFWRFSQLSGNALLHSCDVSARVHVYKCMVGAMMTILDIWCTSFYNKIWAMRLYVYYFMSVCKGSVILENGPPWIPEKKAEKMLRSTRKFCSTHGAHFSGIFFPFSRKQKLRESGKIVDQAVLWFKINYVTI